jgi:hypothetical protein
MASKKFQIERDDGGIQPMRGRGRHDEKQQIEELVTARRRSHSLERKQQSEEKRFPTVLTTTDLPLERCYNCGQVKTDVHQYSFPNESEFSPRLIRRRRENFCPGCAVELKADGADLRIIDTYAPITDDLVSREKMETRKALQLKHLGVVDGKVSQYDERQQLIRDFRKKRGI